MINGFAAKRQRSRLYGSRSSIREVEIFIQFGIKTIRSPVVSVQFLWNVYVLQHLYNQDAKYIYRSIQRVHLIEPRISFLLTQHLYQLRHIISGLHNSHVVLTVTPIGSSAFLRRRLSHLWKTSFCCSPILLPHVIVLSHWRQRSADRSEQKKCLTIMLCQNSFVAKILRPPWGCGINGLFRDTKSSHYP